jgi:hypothetical protein
MSSESENIVIISSILRELWKCRPMLYIWTLLCIYHKCVWYYWYILWAVNTWCTCNIDHSFYGQSIHVTLFDTVYISTTCCNYFTSHLASTMLHLIISILNIGHIGKQNKHIVMIVNHVFRHTIWKFMHVHYRDI